MTESKTVAPHGRSCADCGEPYAAVAGWPRRGISCGAVVFGNPVPVAVGPAPADDWGNGLAIIRCDHRQRRRILASPGGVRRADRAVCLR